MTGVVVVELEELFDELLELVPELELEEELAFLLVLEDELAFLLELEEELGVVLVLEEELGVVLVLVVEEEELGVVLVVEEELGVVLVLEEELAFLLVLEEELGVLLVLDEELAFLLVPEEEELLEEGLTLAAFATAVVFAVVFVEPAAPIIEIVLQAPISSAAAVAAIRSRSALVLRARWARRRRASGGIVVARRGCDMRAVSSRMLRSMCVIAET